MEDAAAHLRSSSTSRTGPHHHHGASTIKQEKDSPPPPPPHADAYEHGHAHDDENRGFQHFILEANKVAHGRKEENSLNSFVKQVEMNMSQDEKLDSTRAKMSEVREENHRLKVYLDRMMKDYQTLQLQFHDIVQQEANTNQESAEKHELVSLSLGRMPMPASSTDSAKNNKSSSTKKEEEAEEDDDDDHQVMAEEGLTLGLDCHFEASPTAGLVEQTTSPNRSHGNSTDHEPNKEASGGGETWPPSKTLKRTKSGEADDELLPQQQSQVSKKPRVSVRARCDAPTMNDGCQWRKYGQKIAKGNPCPRAYYRCTVAPACPVRKQVQRCAEDMSILITTYEGAHSHPLPMSATAMASTTSAAACMLMSGSSSSTFQPGPTGSPSQGLNFYYSPDKASKHKQHLYIANPSSFSSTPNPSHPTITLDLTTTPLPSSLSSSPSKFNNTMSSPNLMYPPRYTTNLPTSLNFTAHPNSWFGQSYSKSPICQENMHHSFFQKIGNYPSGTPTSTTPAQQQSFLPGDSIAAATKAIAADPSFQSALAAALTSIIGGGGVSGGDKIGQNLMKWGEPFQSSSGSNVSGAAEGGVRSSSSLMFLPPASSLPFSSSKSTSSASPPNSTEHTN